MARQKVIVGLGIAWLFVTVGSLTLVYGQPTATDRAGEPSTIGLGHEISLTIGLDVWPNQWVKSTPLFPIGGTAVGQTSAFSVGFIPNATLTYQRFFLSASYMVPTGYQFGKTSFVFAPFGVTPDGLGTPADLLELSTDASRQEGDLTLGYFPVDWLGVAIGYKGIFQRFSSDDTRSVLFGPLPDAESRQNYNGITFGVLASAKIDDRFSLIGNAFGGYLFVDCKPVCLSGNSPYTAAKLVLRYAPTPQVSMTLGYRVQIINNPPKTPSTSESPPILPGLPTEFDAPSAVDLTHGAVMGVNYRF
jgi:hypothetical protein